MPDEDRFRGALLGLDLTPEDAAEALGNGVRADRSVPAAIYARLRFGPDCVGAIRFCMRMGGDTDTVSSMAGAMCGALAGQAALPAELIARAEAADAIASLGSALYKAAA